LYADNTGTFVFINYYQLIMMTNHTSITANNIRGQLKIRKLLANIKLGWLMSGCEVTDLHHSALRDGHSDPKSDKS